MEDYLSCPYEAMCFFRYVKHLSIVEGCFFIALLSCYIGTIRAIFKQLKTWNVAQQIKLKLLVEVMGNG